MFCCDEKVRQKHTRTHALANMRAYTHVRTWAHTPAHTDMYTVHMGAYTGHVRAHTLVHVRTRRVHTHTPPVQHHPEQDSQRSVVSSHTRSGHEQARGGAPALCPQDEPSVPRRGSGRLAQWGTHLKHENYGSVQIHVTNVPSFLEQQGIKGTYCKGPGESVPRSLGPVGLPPTRRLGRPRQQVQGANTLPLALGAGCGLSLGPRSTRPAANPLPDALC